MHHCRLAGAAVAAFGMLSSWAGWCISVTEAQYEAMLKQELPKNASDVNVNAFLLNHQLPHTSDGADAPTYRVEIPHSPQNYLINGTLVMEFHFDANHNLKAYSVVEIAPTTNPAGGKTGEPLPQDKPPASPPSLETPHAEEAVPSVPNADSAPMDQPSTQMSPPATSFAPTAPVTVPYAPVTVPYAPALPFPKPIPFPTMNAQPPAAPANAGPGNSAPIQTVPANGQAQ